MGKGLTFVLLMHEEKVDSLKAMEVVERVVSDAGYGVKAEEGLACEVVGSQHIVVHHREQYHCTFTCALFQRHRTRTHIIKIQ